jgi:DNA sulfur modification protein DndD
MIIKKIKMLNFGPFCGNHEIKFSNDGRGVHVIRGQNGHGKTSIQRAVLWALYGKVYDRKGNEIRPTSLLNRTAAKNDTYKFSVQLHFSHEDSEWTISRKMEALSHQDKKYNSGEVVSVTRDSEPQSNPEEVIRRMLPSDVSRFFFFDGEMLRDYEDLLDQTNASMALLRDSIEHVLGIPFLRTASKDLNQIQRKTELELGRLLKRLGGKDYDQLVDDYQAISDQISEREKRIQEFDISIAKLDVEISDLKRKLTDVAAVKQLAEQRIRIEKDIENQRSKKEKEQEALKRLTADVYKTVLSDTARNILEKLQSMHESRMNKYNEKQKLIGLSEELRKALSAQKCRLCGNVLNQKKLSEIQADLDRVAIQIEKLTEIPEPNLEYEHHADRLRLMLSNDKGREEFANVEKRIMKIDHEIASLTARVEDIRERIVSTGVKEEEPVRLELEIEKITTEKGRLVGLLESEKQQKLDDLEVKAELDQRIAAVDERELDVLKRRIDVAKKLGGIFEKAVAAYRDERRGHVESIATDIFREIRTKESFSRLSINEQFGLNIVTDSGTLLDRSEWRSAGEEQIVAISLIGSLNRCAQIRAPVFMDTPFGRLDTRHGQRVLGYLPKLADQVVLLVTDRELRKGDEKFLRGTIVTDLTVFHKSEEEGCTVYDTASGDDSA